MLQIIKNRKIFLTISGLLIATSITFLSLWGLNFGIDFQGGSLLEVRYNGYQPSISEIQENLQDVEVNNLIIQPTQDSYILRFKENSEEIHREVVSGLRAIISEKEEASLTELQFNSVGPSIGNELKSKSFNAAIIALIMIILFISFAFRKVSLPVASWKYGVASIIALAHDVIITLGLFSFLGHFYGIEINTPFIAAILTILGYSINDTIVVFDRVRDNLPKSKQTFADTVNMSLSQTLGRSLSTSTTTILALLSIYFFGGNTIKDFSLALTIGIFIGTYSSVFVASPALVIWDNLSRKKKAVVVEEE